MDLQRASTPTAVSDEQPDEANLLVHRHWLVFVGILCIVLVVYTLGFFGIGLMLVFAQHRAICTGLTCVLPIPQTLVYFAVASLIFWRKSDHWMALLVALMLVLLAPFMTLPQAFLDLLTSVPVTLVFLKISGFLASATFVSFWFLFPTGRFVPRWSFWILAVTLLCITCLFILPLPHSSAWPLVVGFTFCVIIIVVPTQMHRYFEVSTPVERQQTKWAITGTSIAVVVSFFLFFSDFSTIAYATLLLVPLSIGMAILRSRLYDIEVLINRALIYGTLTGTLALVYFGLVFVLQFLLRGLIGQTNDLSIVISTLAVAALFQPLRWRIQSVIDRRFYRRKYDAAKTLAAFSATLRNEVDLDQLHDQLLAVVQETMQPAHVSLWLRPPAPDEKHWTRLRTPPPDLSEGK